MRQKEEPFGIVMKAEWGELLAWKRESAMREWRIGEEIRAEGTLRRERLERTDTEIETVSRRCHHGEWLR